MVMSIWKNWRVVPLILPKNHRKIEYTFIPIPDLSFIFMMPELLGDIL